MNIPRFRIDSSQAVSASFLLDADESRHAVKVLRLKAGDALELFDGQGKVWSGVVVGVEGARLRVMAGKNRPEARPAVRVELGVALIRPERMDWLVQKACELGAAAVHPLMTRRVIARIPKDKFEDRRRRWSRIAAESCKQCGLSVLPPIAVPRTVQDFIADLPPYDMILLPTLACPGASLARVLSARPGAGKVLVLIGPEGDFTPEEVDSFVRAGGEPVDLGALVLRSETAAIYLLSALKFHFEGVRG